MVGTYVLYRLALPGTDRPIEVSIATLGGNLVVVAFVLRAERAKHRWKRGKQRRIARTQDKLQRLEAHMRTLYRDDSRMAATLNLIVEMEADLNDWREELQAGDE